MKKETTKNTTNRRVYKILNYGLDPYWDEGINFYPKYKPGRHQCRPKLMSYQIRMYKTWKHNRNTQYK